MSQKAMTPKMQQFNELNAQSKVVFAERLTKQGKPVFSPTDLSNSDRVRYKFQNGQTITLRDADAISDPNFSPKWDLGV